MGMASGFYLHTDKISSIPYIYTQRGAIFPFWSVAYRTDSVIAKHNAGIKAWAELSPYTKRKIREAVKLDLIKARFTG